MKPSRVAKNAPAKPAEHGAHGEGGELGRGCVDAKRAAGDLVLAQRLPGASDRQPPQPQRDPVGEERQRNDEVVEKHGALRRRVGEAESRGKAVVGGGERQSEERRMRRGDAVRAAGEILPVEQNEPDDLAEAERDDCQIVAAQPQHRKAEQEAGEGGEDAGERQTAPKRKADILREQSIGIGADRVEGDVAEIEQPGEADHDVETEAEHSVGGD